MLYQVLKKKKVSMSNTLFHLSDMFSEFFFKNKLYMYFGRLDLDNGHHSKPLKKLLKNCPSHVKTSHISTIAMLHCLVLSDKSCQPQLCSTI